MRPALGICAAVIAACSTADAAEPWTVERARTASVAPRILLVYDMEGLSGQDDVFTWQDTHPEQYAKGRRLLTDDVNAVIRGLFAAGAGAVSVLDCHGGGNHDIDILADEVDPRATRITEAPVGCASTFARPGAFDAVAAVGMHAGGGSGGFSAHTSTLGVQMLLAGRPVNETEMSALAYGEAGIPVIFASGDDVLGRELAPLGWIEYVEVKKAKGPTFAELRPLAEARLALEAGAKRAVTRIPSAWILKAKAPVALTLRAYPPADLSWLAGIPGAALDRDSMTVTAPSFRAASAGIAPVLDAAMQRPTRIVLQAAQRHPDWKKIEREAVEELMRLWSESESTRAER